MMMIGAIATAQNSMVHIIPQPVDMQVLTGSWMLTGGAVISYNKTEGKKIADMLAQKLNMPTGFKLSARQGLPVPFRSI